MSTLKENVDLGNEISLVDEEPHSLDEKKNDENKSLQATIKEYLDDEINLVLVIIVFLALCLCSVLLCIICCKKGKHCMRF